MWNVVAISRLLAMGMLLVGSAFAGAKFQVIHHFKGGNDGQNPAGTLTFDRAGNLYGATFYGGSTTSCFGIGCGTIFELTPKSGVWYERVLSTFPYATSGNAVYPAGPLAIDDAGNIYGVGAGSGTFNGQSFFGQLFDVVHTGGSFTTNAIHFFTGGTDDGIFTNPGLLADGDGNLYGSASAGGAYNNNGVVFQFSPNSDGTWTENLICDFATATSVVPTGSMLIDKAGNLYGTTIQGGAYGWGSVYKLSQINGIWSIQSLYDFPPPLNGQYPAPGGLVMDTAGNLYVNTQYGGTWGLGSIFKLEPTIGYWRYSLVHSFTGSTDGGYPAGRVAVDIQGNLYGTTYSGGIFQRGTVYKFAPGPRGWAETVLHNFTAGSDGSQPQGVTVDGSGNLFGVTQYGGKYLDGVAYEITQ